MKINLTLSYRICFWNRMNLVIRLWLILWQLNGFASAYCLYGNSSDCAFQCHCAVDSECDGGRCPSGCDTAPLGYNWTGPACQIGNVGLHKSANMTTDSRYRSRYPPSAALDGVSPRRLGSQCALINNIKNNPAEWWADLGDVYKIYNITIYGRTDCCEERLQQFDLTVYNTSDNKVLCAHYNDSIKTYNTITCTRPVIGRYVHFKRTGGPEIQQTTLCEVVIIGHKYIDCALCPRDVACNDVTGCEQCDGSYQPDCKRACQAGYYGVNCKKKCGQCKQLTACDSSNGRCLSGCELWWTDTTCHTYIDQPNHSNETVTLIVKSSDSIQIQWQPIDGIPSNLSDFYGYLIQYKIGTTDHNYTQAGIVKPDTDPLWTFEDLESGREYFIEIKPFREYEDKKEFGTPYNTLQVKTDGVDALTAGTITSIVLNVLFAAVIILLVIFLWKSRIASALERWKNSKQTVELGEMQPEASKQEATRVDSKERTSSEHRCAEEVCYATVTEERSVNNQEGRQGQDNFLSQYEDVTSTVRLEERDKRHYEGLTTETGRLYENRLVRGPYTELHK